MCFRPGGPNSFYHNLGGEDFEEIAVQLGIDETALSASGGACAADVDNDGDVDLYIQYQPEGGRVYYNHYSQSGALGFTKGAFIPATVGTSGQVRVALRLL